MASHRNLVERFAIPDEFVVSQRSFIQRFAIPDEFSASHYGFIGHRKQLCAMTAFVQKLGDVAGPSRCDFYTWRDNGLPRFPSIQTAKHGARD